MPAGAASLEDYDRFKKTGPASPRRRLSMTIDLQFKALLRQAPLLSTSALRARRKELSSRMAGAPAAEVLRLALSAVDAGGHANRLVAYELVLNHGEALTRVTGRV